MTLNIGYHHTYVKGIKGKMKSIWTCATAAAALAACIYLGAINQTAIVPMMMGAMTAYLVGIATAALEEWSLAKQYEGE
jgi:hypothetical protein